MRHGDKVKKLSKNTSHRRALLRNLAAALFKYENIQTTVQKAKALRPYAEKIITKAKSGTLPSKRAVNRDIKDRGLLKKLFEDIALRYKNRHGGYTRIYKLGKRMSDGSEMALIELVEESLVKEAGAGTKEALPAVKEEAAAEAKSPEKKRAPRKKPATAKKTAKKEE
jgi:large subunit ribosomal protein L17